MFTQTSLARLGALHPELRRRIFQLDSLVPNISLQVAQGYRTYTEQNSLFLQVPKVTDAGAGYSMHNFALAADLVPEDIMPGQPDWDITHPAWQKMLAVAPSCGLAEGAKWRTFVDNPHFYPAELPATPTDQMREWYADGGLAEVWKGLANILPFS